MIRKGIAGARRLTATPIERQAPPNLPSWQAPRPPAPDKPTGGDAGMPVLKWIWIGVGVLVFLLLLTPGGRPAVAAYQPAGFPQLGTVGGHRVAGPDHARCPGGAAYLRRVRADAYFAMGYLHAQDRLWQMHLQRRLGAGRLAEVIGERGLGVDRFMRLIGALPAGRGKLFPTVLGSARALDSYAAGVNAWLETRRGALPPEFYLLRNWPEPWTPADSLVWGKLMALQLPGNYRAELQRAELSALLGEDALSVLFPERLAEEPVTLANYFAPDRLPQPARRPAAMLGRQRPPTNGRCRRARPAPAARSWPMTRISVSTPRPCGTWRGSGPRP